MFGGRLMVRSRRGRFTHHVAVASLSVVAFGATASAQNLKTDRAPAAGAASDAAVAQLQSLSDAFATVAARVRPSVVYITAKQPVRAASRGRAAPQFPGLPPEMQRFFEMPGMPDGPGTPRGEVASGSGFIVSR